MPPSRKVYPVSHNNNSNNNIIICYDGTLFNLSFKNRWTGVGVTLMYSWVDR